MGVGLARGVLTWGWGWCLHGVGLVQRSAYMGWDCCRRAYMGVELMLQSAYLLASAPAHSEGWSRIWNALQTYTQPKYTLQLGAPIIKN